jgi:hypothetical protein
MVRPAQPPDLAHRPPYRYKSPGVRHLHGGDKRTSYQFLCSLSLQRLFRYKITQAGFDGIIVQVRQNVGYISPFRMASLNCMTPAN